jgi:CRP/FNR family transcriptional regulator
MNQSLTNIDLSPLFSGLESSDLRRLEAIAVTKTLKRGETLFLEGDHAEGFYAVVKGLIKVYKIGSDGREQVLHLVGPGHTFAEAALFGEGRYPANAEAVQPSELKLIPKRPFVELLRTEPELALKMLASLSHWMKRLLALVETLSLKNVEARLADYIISRAREEGLPMKNGIAVTLDVEKKMIAARLGTISETLSRSLKKLKDRELIREEGSRIIITNLKALEELAES